MALTKKMLQAMDIAEDKIDQIIEAHRASINGLTDERDSLKAELEKQKADLEKLKSVEKELVKAQAKIEDADEVAEKYKKLKEDFDAYKSDVEAKTTQATKEKAYKELLKEAGISEKRFDAIIKITDLSGVEIGADGKVKDAKKIVEDIKTEWADFVVTQGKQGAQTATPPAGNGGNTFEKMSLAEKMAYANENPESEEVKAWLK